MQLKIQLMYFQSRFMCMNVRSTIFVMIIINYNGGFQS
jgi:hypothetical protein